MRSLLLIPALAAVAIAGCGANGSKNDYVKSVNKVEASLQQSLSGLGGIGAATSPAQAAAKLEAGGKALDDAADSFNAIKPPNDAKHAHGLIVDGLHKLAGTLHDAAKAAKSNDRAAAAKTLSDVGTGQGIKEIQAAQDELTANGYKFKSS